MELAAFIDQAWADHGEAPEAVAQRLEAATVDDPAQVAPFVRLAVHVFAVHLGAVERGVALLARLPEDPSVARGIATLRFVGGAADALAGLGDEDRIFALSVGSTVFADRGEFAPAIAALQDALAIEHRGLPDDSPAQRWLAAGGNNLAEALESKAERSAAETAAMVEAAEAALRCWKLAGGWLEHERAEYRLAASLLKAGRAAEAAQAAQRCLDVCIANDAPDFERFFGHAMLARARRAAGDAAGCAASRVSALECLERVPADERTWCEADRAALDG